MPNQLLNLAFAPLSPYTKFMVVKYLIHTETEAFAVSLCKEALNVYPSRSWDQAPLAYGPLGD